MARKNTRLTLGASTVTTSTPGSEGRANLLRLCGFVGTAGRRAEAVERILNRADRRGGYLSIEEAEEIVSDACQKLLFTSGFVAPPGGPSAELEAFRRYSAIALQNAYSSHVQQKCGRAAKLQRRYEARLYALKEREQETADQKTADSASQAHPHTRARVKQSNTQPSTPLNGARQRADIRWRDMELYHASLEWAAPDHFPAPDRCLDLLAAAHKAEELLAPLSQRDRTILLAVAEGTLDLIPFSSPAARRKAKERAIDRLQASLEERGLVVTEHQRSDSLRRAA